MYRSQHNQAAGRFKLSRYFKNGEAGFHNQLLLPSTVFTTDGGSTSVSASGDSVGRIDNLISSGTPDLTQATAGSRPTWARIPRGGVRNRITYSQEFDNAAWTKLRASVSANAVVAPDGTTTADKLVEDSTAANTHFMRQDVSVTSGVTYTKTIYAKAAERSEFSIRFDTDNSAFAANEIIFSLSDGSVVSTSGTLVSYSATSAGNGWWRLSATATATATATFVNRYFLCVSGSTVYNGDGASGAYVWGAQIEAASSATALQTVTSNFDITESGVPSIWIPYFDGGDFLTTGVQSFGGASFFADAGQAWWVAGAFSSFSSGLLIAKAASGTGGDSTMLVNLVSGGTVRCRLRGGLTDPASGATDGRLHVWLMVWNGSAATFYFDGAAGVSMTVGAAVEEATNIVVGARTDSLPAGHLTGYNHISGFGNRALSAAEQTQIMAWMRNYYGTP